MLTMLSTREEQIVKVLVNLNNNASLPEIAKAAGTALSITASNTAALLGRLINKGVVAHSGDRRNYRYRVRPVVIEKGEIIMPRGIPNKPKAVQTVEVSNDPIDVSELVGVMVNRLESQAVEIETLKRQKDQLQRQLPQMSAELKAKLARLGVLPKS